MLGGNCPGTQARPGNGVVSRNCNELRPGRVQLEQHHIRGRRAGIFGVAAIDRAVEAAHQRSHLRADRKLGAGRVCSGRRTRCPLGQPLDALGTGARLPARDMTCWPLLVSGSERQPVQGGDIVDIRNYVRMLDGISDPDSIIGEPRVIVDLPIAVGCGLDAPSTPRGGNFM